MQQTLSKHYLQQIPATKDKLTVLLVVVTPTLDENLSSHFKTPTFPPVASCLHYNVWGGSSGFSQKRQNRSSRLWSPKLPLQCSLVTAAVYSHRQVRDRFRGDPVALALGWNWTGMEINGRANLPPTARILCVCLGCGAACFLQEDLPNEIFLKVTMPVWLTCIEPQTYCKLSLSHVLNFAAEQDAAASRRLPTVTSSHVLSSTEWVGCAALLLCCTTWAGHGWANTTNAVQQFQQVRQNILTLDIRHESGSIRGDLIRLMKIVSC